MRTKTIKLKKQLPDEEADLLAGKFLDESHYDILIQDDTRVLKPNGEPLLVFRRDLIPAKFCKAAYKNLRDAAFGNNRKGNRGMAGGEIREDLKINGKPVQVIGVGVRAKVKMPDGTLSSTTYSNPVESGIVGFFERTARNPYCRLTAYNLHHGDRFAKALPFIKALDQCFKEELPDRYANQKKVVQGSSPDFVIQDTVFSTITVNHNFRTATHKDAGDLKEGFGVMTCLRAGKFSGGYLVFPKYRVAVDMTTRCVCLADVHEWHGNTPIIGIKGAFERISCVLYYRENIKYCGTAEEEHQRAKTRQKGEELIKVKPQ